ncbi:hypothetical protein BDV29DRAFT_165143 [Aspergillus leporis]|uniref:Uncharacterized protein n=1 Tax=Aspergillus leporis TaxID=41062 RepID=A0A5N5XIG0_9EURO|nr:hypothetical protein BDV29DRAFT_165143 [Aspergillus leporis]
MVGYSRILGSHGADSLALFEGYRYFKLSKGPEKGPLHNIRHFLTPFSHSIETCQ